MHPFNAIETQGLDALMLFFHVPSAHTGTHLIARSRVVSYLKQPADVSTSSDLHPCLQEAWSGWVSGGRSVGEGGGGWVERT